MIQVNQISCPIDADMNKLESTIAKKCHIQASDITSYSIVRQSLDARKELCYKLTVHLVTPLENKILRIKNKDIHLVEPIPEISFKCENEIDERPIVIGFGPAGMFSALALAEAGCKPIVLERGKAVDERILDVEEFWKNGKLNPTSNVQFGEGGAGTFSDGKLTTRVKDNRIHYVLSQLVEAGADEKIIYQQHPHIGTDELRKIVKNIRLKIERLGGCVHFNHQVDDFIIENHQIIGVHANNQTFNSKHIVLAIGHSATDTIMKLHQQKVDMSAKDISVGVRVEHLQNWVNERQYKEHVNNPYLSSAEYRLTAKTSTNRGVFTFCMCPGGSVVAASSDEGKLVVNGMSESKRDSIFANSALLVQCPVENKEEPFASLKIIEQLEKKAFLLANQSYKAPAQRIQDYLNNQASTSLPNTSYLLGCTPCNLNELFIDEINTSLKEGILHFEKIMPGFLDGVLIGVESRSSSPVRLSRNEKFQSNNTLGLYPCGEGAGYAGGIVSAALDGLRCAQAILNEYNN